MTDDWHVRIEAELLACPTLTPVQKLQYAYLRFRQGTNAAAWPSYTTIAEDLGVSMRTSKRTSAELERLGLLRIVTGGGRGKANEYTIGSFAQWAANRDSMAPFPVPKNGDNVAPFHGRKGDKLSNKGCQLVQETVTKWHPKKNKEREQEKEQACSLSREGLVLLAQLRESLRITGNDCHAGVRNAVRWATRQSPEVCERLLTIARESSNGQPPYRLWMSRIKSELGYVPPSSGQPKRRIRGAEPQPIGAIAGDTLAHIRARAGP